MRYLRATWVHDDPDDPVELWSELDDNSWEVRKIERFRDGFVGWADAGGSSPTTMLGLEPMPSTEEINCDPEFQVAEITREEFEHCWILAARSIGSKAVS